MRPERDSSLQVAPSVALHVLQPLPHACASLPARNFPTHARCSALPCLQLCADCNNPGGRGVHPWEGEPSQAPATALHMLLLLSRAQPILMHRSTCSHVLCSTFGRLIYLMWTPDVVC